MKTLIKIVLIWAWWYMPVIPTLWRIRQEALKFEASLGYTEQPYLKKTENI
jgi:hypothetical protein